MGTVSKSATTVFVVLLVLGVLVGAWLAGGAKAATAGEGGVSGPWAIAADGGGGYLLNTRTGDVWRLREDLKVRVREPNP